MDICNKLGQDFLNSPQEDYSFLKKEFVNNLTDSQIKAYFGNKNLEGKYNKRNIIISPDLISLNNIDLTNSENIIAFRRFLC